MDKKVRKYMKIIKHGSPVARETKFFICTNCGCEWEADKTEYQFTCSQAVPDKTVTATRYMQYESYSMDCPECGKNIIQYSQAPVRIF